MIDATSIGVVETDAGEPLPEERTDRESTVVVDADYVEGLYRIEGNDHLVVVFHLHEASEPTLRGPRRYGEERGVFASRSPNRPGKVGVTTVELVERDGRRLRVRGLDARGGTPVLDLKPHAPSLDCPSRAPGDDRRENPRGRVDRAVRARDLETLLLDAGEFHGHFCPALSLGLMAGVFARRELGVDPGDGEALVTVVETNDCFADGIRYATGCTFGNGALVYRDLGKPAVTVARRGGGASVSPPPTRTSSTSRRGPTTVSSGATTRGIRPAKAEDVSTSDGRRPPSTLSVGRSSGSATSGPTCRSTSPTPLRTRAS